ncbi:MAG: hypothetical protein Kow0099_11250 [Candidatus Abyssubacteria bacterium]
MFVRKKWSNHTDSSTVRDCRKDLSNNVMGPTIQFLGLESDPGPVTHVRGARLFLENRDQVLHLDFARPDPIPL